MKKLIALLLVSGTLSFYGLARAADDLAVGDPVGSGGKVTHQSGRHHRSTHKHHHTKTGTQTKAKGGVSEKTPENSGSTGSK